MWWVLPARQQLAWLTAKIAPLEGYVEVDFLAEVPVLEGHVARCRPTWTRRSQITRSSVLLLSLWSRTVSGNRGPRPGAGDKVLPALPENLGARAGRLIYCRQHGSPRATASAQEPQLMGGITRTIVLIAEKGKKIDQGEHQHMIMVA